MPLAFADWLRSYEAAVATDPRRRARLLNLAREWRIASALDLFRASLVTHFASRVAAGDAPGRAAIDALDEAVADIVPNAATYAFLIRLRADYDGKAVSHMAWRKLLRYSAIGRLAPRDPPPTLPVRLSNVRDADKVAWWMTADRCPDDPDEMAKSLGLPHFQGTVAYRFELDVAGLDQYEPTCLDAGLYEAFQEPPSGHGGPCGLTRHVETGKRIHNEFIIRSTDVDGRAVIMERLPLGRPATSIGPMNPDFLVGR